MGFQIDRIAFSYEKRQVIKDISLNLDKGAFYGILGPNGCGKSTFIDLLTGHQRPGHGNVKYKGRDVSDYSRREMAREMALVPQNFYINFPFTAREIVIMGRYPHIPRFSPPMLKDIEIVDNIMKMTGTAKFKDRYMTEMSGGERQRVIFARALAQDTPVLLLDEATSNLDVSHTLTLLDIVSRNVREKGKTVIAVFQDINIAATYCSHLIMMKEGFVSAFGGTDDVFTKENIKKVFNVESHVYFDSYSNSRKVSFKKIDESHF